MSDECVHTFRIEGEVVEEEAIKNEVPFDKL